MTQPSVSVIGGGVIGRTCALELARAGHRVTLLTKDPVETTTSSKAAAVWFPFQAFPIDRVNAWSARTFHRLAALTEAWETTGVRMTAGTSVIRSSEADLGWLDAVPGAWVDESADARPAGALAVARATVPAIDMSRYLPWLARAGADAGVMERAATVSSVDEAEAFGDLVVVATGLETNALVSDAECYPIQGQIVRVAHPGGTVEWMEDTDRSDGHLVYVIPRIDEVVIGGTEVVGAWSTEIDMELEAAMIARAAEIMPWIADAPITSRAVGLRPGRASVRLERIGDAIHCYGHGGSGVTVSYGCAEEVVALAAL